MTPRLMVRQWLQARRTEVAIPPSRQLRHLRHVRIRRFTLPAGVSEKRDRAGNRVVLVDMDRIVNRPVFSYGRHGWHPFVAALEEKLEQPDLPFERSVLARFFDRCRPTSMHDVFFGERDVRPGTLATWPVITELFDVWTVTPQLLTWARERSERAAGPVHTSFVGPATLRAGADHLGYVLRSYEKISREGYRPEDFGYVTGHFVSRGEDYRFVVGHGNHRLAALRVLGYDQIPVTFRRSHPPVIAADALDRWTLSRGGLLEDHEARALFDRFFADDSISRSEALGLRQASGDGYEPPRPHA